MAYIKKTDHSALKRLWELRWLARTDLLWLCHNVLEFRDMHPRVHGPVIQHLQQFPMPTTQEALESDLILDTGKFKYTPVGDPYLCLEGPRKRMIFDSRSYFKTSLCTVAHTIQWLLNYPHIAMGIFFATDSKSQDVLKNGIKRQFQTNQKLREIFPDYCPQARIMDWGTAENFVLPNRDEVLQRLGRPPRIEDSVKSLSLDKSKAGYHFDIIKCSDLVDDKNSISPSQRETIMQDFGLMPRLLVLRPDNKDGWIDLEGTFYHPDDLHNNMIKAWRQAAPEKRRWQIFVRGVFKRDIRESTCKAVGIAPRETHRFDPDEMMLPFALDGNGKRISNWPEADPIEKLEAEEVDLAEGGTRFACTPGWAPILMSDWSEKPIADVEIGDEIVGWHNPVDNFKRRHLTRAKVLDKGFLSAEVVEIEMEDGEKLYSTPDHLWLTQRTLDQTHHTEFAQPKVGRKFQRVYKVADFDIDISKIRAWAYLSGLIDGEGHIDTKPNRANVTITQSPSKNPEICKRIESTLEFLNIRYNVHRRKVKKLGDGDAHIYWIKGGRSVKLRMLKNMDFAKRFQMVEHLWSLKGRLSDGGGHGTRWVRGGQKVVAVRPRGVETVYWLQTETGNYVSQGYASKNSQRVLDFSADRTSNRPFQQGANWRGETDYQHVPIDYRVITVDLADTTGPKSNPSVVTVAGFDRKGRCYVENIQRGKWGPDGTLKVIFDTFASTAHCRLVSIEDYAYVRGLKPSIQRECFKRGVNPPFEYIKRDRSPNGKVKRILQALVPPFNSGELFFIDPLNSEDRTCKLLGTPQPTRIALEEELRTCTAQSTGTSDDILDTLADLFITRGNAGLNRGALPDEATILELRRRAEAADWERMCYGEDEVPDSSYSTGW